MAGEHGGNRRGPHSSHTPHPPPRPLMFDPRAVLSEDAVTTRLPSGLNDAPTRPVWPASTVGPAPARQLPYPRRVVQDAVTTRLPSGLNDALDRAVWPASRWTGAARSSHTRAVLSQTPSPRASRPD